MTRIFLLILFIHIIASCACNDVNKQKVTAVAELTLVPEVKAVPEVAEVPAQIVDTFSYYEANDILFDSIIVEKTDLKIDNGVTLNLIYEFIYPKSRATKEIANIRDSIAKEFFLLSTPISTFKDAQRIYEKRIIDEVSSDCANTSTYYNVLVSRVAYNKDIMVFSTHLRWYRGGAHGLEGQIHYCYDLSTGTQITLDDLFYEKDHPEIERILTEHYAKRTMEDLYISSNFIIQPLILELVYCPYQIDYYAAGTIHIEFPLNKFEHLLKPGAESYFKSEHKIKIEPYNKIYNY